MFRYLPLQTEIFPCKGKYSDKELAAFDRTWAGVIKEKLLPYLCTVEAQFAPFFHQRLGRPIKHIPLLIVLHILKEIYDWTDEQVIEASYFDKRLEYVFELPFEEIRVCQKTLHNFRQLILENELAQSLFDQVCAHIIKILNINTSMQRLDSTHTTSNMAKLSRLGLFVRVIENFLHKLKKIDAVAYQQLPARFQERYAQRRGFFADARSSKTQHRLGDCANDMWYLIDHFRGDEKIMSSKVMALLKRVFDEHCYIQPAPDCDTITVQVSEVNVAPVDTTKEIQAPQASSAQPEESTSPGETNPAPSSLVVLKDTKEIPSSSLQNPSDEDAAYGYKGQGYEVTFTETCSPDNPVQIITDVQVDPSNCSDQNKTIPVVDRLAANGIKPDVLFGDGGFVSGENIIDCAEREVDLQGNLTGSDCAPENLKLADFKIAEDGITIQACPEGHAPTSQKQQRARHPDPEKVERRFMVHFNREVCAGCPLLSKCQVTLQKKRAVLRFSQVEMVTSRRRREQATSAFKERNNIRAAIESTFHAAKTGQGMDQLRVRGRPRVTMVACFKALGRNVKRMVRCVLSLLKTACRRQKDLAPAGNLA